MLVSSSYKLYIYVRIYENQTQWSKGLERHWSDYAWKTVHQLKKRKRLHALIYEQWALLYSADRVANNDKDGKQLYLQQLSWWFKLSEYDVN